MSKAVLFVDVGTHEAQEYAAIFSLDHLTYLRRWLKSRRQATRSGDIRPSFIEFRNFLATVAWLRNRRKLLYYVMIEPNARLFARRIYRDADLAMNIALATDARSASIRPLFHANKNPIGQGNSLFIEKPNVATNQFDLVLCVDPRHFAEQLNRSLTSLGEAEISRVILRLNNEGAEVEVIRAFHAVFGARLSLVMGSLSDVVKVKGQKAHDALMSFLQAEGIDFLPFNSGYATWPQAAERIARLLGYRQG